jgi:hypothetical protein
MNALETSYETLRQQYDALIAANDPSKLPQITSLNTQMSGLLQEMLGEVAKMKGNAAKLQIYRNELMAKLVSVQNDFSLMQEQKDQYQTLTRLQTHEQTVFYSVFFWYGIALAIVFFAFVMILTRNGQSAPTIPTTTTNAMTTPAFM